MKRERDERAVKDDLSGIIVQPPLCFMHSCIAAGDICRLQTGDWPLLRNNSLSQANKTASNYEQTSVN